MILRLHLLQWINSDFQTSFTRLKKQAGKSALYWLRYEH